MKGFLILVALCLALRPGIAGAGSPDLEGLIDTALAKNTGLKVLEHRLAAFEARVPRAGALDDPMLRLDLKNVPAGSLDFDSTPMSGKQLSVSQRFPLPGVLRAKQMAAEYAAGAAREALLDRKVSIVSRVKQEYFALAFYDRAIEVTEKNRTLLEDLIRIAQKKYEVGSGLQQDVLKAHVSLSALRDRLIRLESGWLLALARLNRVLDRPPRTSVIAPRQVSPTPFEHSVQEIQRQALAHRPMLKKIEQAISGWSATEQVARRSGWPDLTFHLGYMQRDAVGSDPVKGSDFLSFGVGLNLPVFNGRKRDSRVAEAQAHVRMGRARKEDASREILFLVERICLEIEQHWKEAELYRTAIVPQAQQSLESAMAAYQVDKVDFLTLLNNQVSLFDFEIEYYRHVIQREKKLAELESVVGKRLF